MWKTLACLVEKLTFCDTFKDILFEYAPGGGGVVGHSLVSSVPMRDQRIVEHTLNSVIDI